MNRKAFISAGIIFLISLSLSCVNHYATPDYTSAGYPQEIGSILMKRCATSGCHTSKSKAATAGLSLETWEDMMEGGRSGAVVIPYRSDFSTLFYSINTFSDLGLSLSPAMPFGASSLNREETELIKNWIDQGAPNSEGFVKYTDNPSRPKLYITNKGCDVISIIDRASGKIMRCIDAGMLPSVEGPCMTKVSPDGQYWYVIFVNTSIIQKFRTSDNSFVGFAEISYGNWNSFVISPDSKKAYIADFYSPGRIACVDLENMILTDTWTNNGNFILPYASALNQNGDTLYVSAQFGNFIYKIPVNNPANVSEITLNSSPPTTNPWLNPSSIIFSSDYKRYYVACEYANEVRIMNTTNDSLLGVVSTDGFPSELALSSTLPYLFVSCMEDSLSFPGKKGSVAVINTTTNTLIKKLYTGHQPRGLFIDELTKKVYVSNRNASAGGPDGHHAPRCSGKNGYISIIDMNSLDVLPTYKTEVSVDPYQLGAN